jgi:hypothetical protein
MHKLKQKCILILILIPLYGNAQLTYPTKHPTAVIPHMGDGHRLLFLYTPMQFINGIQDTFKLYYYHGGNGRSYLARSTNFGISWTDTQAVFIPENSKIEAIIRNPNSSPIYLGYNRWDGQLSYMNKAVSTDGGLSFSDTARVMALGEDKSFIWNTDTDEYWGYVRPRNITPDCNCYIHDCFTLGNGVRKIALMKNGGFFPNPAHWSLTDTDLVKISQSDYATMGNIDFRKQPYYMQVFRSGSDWWGLVGMYRVGNNGGETNDTPYVGLEYTVDVELMWSDNGEDWHRTNNRNPFIPIHDSIKTIYGVGTVVEDSVYFYTFEKTSLHAPYTTRGCGNTNADSASFLGRYYSIYLSKMSVSKLNEWRPPSVFNVTAVVEGFLNTGTSMLNIRDTLEGELRDASSPYALIDSVKAVIDSVTFLGKFDFSHVSPGNYYLTLEGRNSIKTWSDSALYVSNGTATNHDFTLSSGQAYGSNLVLKGGEYCIYSGDVDNDGFVNLTDVSYVYTDADNYVTGYVDTDIDGNNIVDLTDVLITQNNSGSFVQVIMP